MINDQTNESGLLSSKKFYRDLIVNLRLSNKRESFKLTRHIRVINKYGINV